jgi:Arc/MetJ-type ribon-helix-helix transcriptional regulator
MSKERVTVTVDAELLQAARDAVEAGLADSLSAWVNRALRDRVARERQLAALAVAVGAYEAEHGEIGEDEIVRQRRADREAAVVVRGSRRGAA